MLTTASVKATLTSASVKVMLTTAPVKAVPHRLLKGGKKGKKGKHDEHPPPRPPVHPPPVPIPSPPPVPTPRPAQDPPAQPPQPLVDTPTPTPTPTSPPAAIETDSLIETNPSRPLPQIKVSPTPGLEPVINSSTRNKSSNSTGTLLAVVGAGILVMVILGVVGYRIHKSMNEEDDDCEESTPEQQHSPFGLGRPNHGYIGQQGHPQQQQHSPFGLGRPNRQV